MRTGYDVDAVRAAEHALLATLPPGALMQRAAAGLARRCAAVLGQVYGSRVTLLIGSGDNGGDALFAGARLAGRGGRVEAVLVAGQAHPSGLAALLAAGGRALTPSAAADASVAAADLIVDGVLGIGGRGALRPPADRLAELAAASGAFMVAVDVPSGVDAGSGRVDGPAVRADLTVTFGAVKAGLLVLPGSAQAGTLELVDIGLGPYLPAPEIRVLEAEDAAALLPAPGADSDKYRRGVVGVVAGSPAYTGAAVLATGAAVHAGAGMVRYAGVSEPAGLVRGRWPEVVCTVLPAGPGGAPADPAGVLAAGRVQAWVVGPGLGTGADAAAVVAAILSTDLPVLVDADGLTVLSQHREWVVSRDAPTLLTPHAGEFARLLDTDRAEVEADRLGWTTRAAAQLRATVLLKGSTTVVADADGRVFVNPTGTAQLATAGSGDVLSGACGALLAQGLDPLSAGAVGAYLHGLAARLPRPPIAALDVITHWRDAVAIVRP